MTTETKQCQNCKAPFVIEPDDFDFYKKIDVPAPTWCPECRMVRRMSFRNERAIYKRKCGRCSKDTISVYHPDSPFTVYCSECFYGDGWDPLSFGRDYDFSKPFFEQFKELLLRAPKLANQRSNDLVNSEFVNHLSSSRNCYLVFASTSDEDCMYCNYVSYSRGIIDGLRIFKGEECFDSVDCTACRRLNFSQQCQDSYNGWFLFNCRSCSDCFLCTNLVHKSHCIRNVQYTKQEYDKQVSKIDTGNARTIESLRSEFEDMKKNTLRRGVEGFNITNSSGNFLRNVRGCRHCFDLGNAESCTHVTYGDNVVDTYDAYGAYPKTELCYEVVGSGVSAYNAKFSYSPWAVSDVEYCIIVLLGSANCFGCTQLHKMQYCILNTQYTKEEYEALIPRIKKHMDDMPYIDQKGREYKYGEFFPPELSPFAYNETIAQEYFPLTKDEAIKQGFRWRDPDTKEYKVTKTPDSLPDHIKDIDDSILQEVIGCSHKGTCSHQCTTAFKIIPEELSFYRRMNLPLPRLCPNCRHYERLKQRNPLKLWHRTCMCDKPTHQHGEKPCPNEFETSYSPERKEVVYCESCYNSEVV